MKINKFNNFELLLLIALLSLLLILFLSLSVFRVFIGLDNELSIDTFLFMFLLRLQILL